MTVHECRWGILATGFIAQSFTKDLLVDPATRKVSDVKHRVVAVASSTSRERAAEFAKECGVPGGDGEVKFYGSYEEFVTNPDIDCVYVATPHSHHYDNVKLCLESGKNVLCEKPFTVNAEQLTHLVEIAKKKNLFLMEAVWTRYFPLVLDLQRKLFEDKVLGRIHKVTTDFGMPFDPDNIDAGHRLMNPALAGGALLDLGIYNITWVYLTCYHDPRNERQDPVVSSGMLKNKRTGVDEFTSVSLMFPRSHVCATVQCNMTVKSDKECVVRIQGEKGDIAVQWGPFRPTSFKLYKRKDIKDFVEDEPEVFDFPIPGHGMFWEADEVARCLRDGKKESDRMPLDESLSTMRLMDLVRKQNDFRYPDEIERVSR